MLLKHAPPGTFKPQQGEWASFDAIYSVAETAQSNPKVALHLIESCSRFFGDRELCLKVFDSCVDTILHEAFDLFDPNENNATVFLENLAKMVAYALLPLLQAGGRASLTPVGFFTELNEIQGSLRSFFESINDCRKWTLFDLFVDIHIESQTSKLFNPIDLKKLIQGSVLDDPENYSAQRILEAFPRRLQSTCRSD